MPVSVISMYCLNVACAYCNYHRIDKYRKVSPWKHAIFEYFQGGDCFYLGHLLSDESCRIKLM